MTLGSQRAVAPRLLQRPNPLRLRAAPVLTARRNRLSVQAFALQPLVPILARAVTAGVLLYASMNYVYYRGMRKDTEKAVEKYEEQGKKQKERLDRLNGKHNNEQ
ncbi:hypothetical protein N2152v2_005453 [Parachlorella kessleri]